MNKITLEFSYPVKKSSTEYVYVKMEFPVSSTSTMQSLGSKTLTELLSMGFELKSYHII
jgi:hypothetical protein